MVYVNTVYLYQAYAGQGKRLCSVRLPPVPYPAASIRFAARSVTVHTPNSGTKAHGQGGSGSDTGAAVKYPSSRISGHT